MQLKQRRFRERLQQNQQQRLGREYLRLSCST